MFWGFFKFALAAICVGLLVPLAVACGGGGGWAAAYSFHGILDS